MLSHSVISTWLLFLFVICSSKYVVKYYRSSLRFHIVTEHLCCQTAVFTPVRLPRAKILYKYINIVLCQLFWKSPAVKLQQMLVVCDICEAAAWQTEVLMDGMFFFLLFLKCCCSWNVRATNQFYMNSHQCGILYLSVTSILVLW